MKVLIRTTIVALLLANSTCEHTMCPRRGCIYVDALLSFVKSRCNQVLYAELIRAEILCRMKHACNVLRRVSPDVLRLLYFLTWLAWKEVQRLAYDSRSTCENQLYLLRTMNGVPSLFSRSTREPHECLNFHIQSQPDRDI